MNRTSGRSSRARRTFTVTALALASLTVAAPAPANAAAAAPAFQLPFPCGEKWQLNSWGHAPALDMVKEPNQAGTDGAKLIAPADGTVVQSTYHSNAGNMIQINHGGGWFTTYIHLKTRSVSVNQRVTQGQQIGQVGATGPTSNGHPHLHYEQAFDSNGDGRASWGAPGTERVRPTFNGVEYGQSNGQEWNNVTSANGCSVAPVEGRLYREPSGTIAVVAGGAPVRFSSMEELNASGYEGAPFTNVPAGWLNTLPQSPRDGTYLRNAADGGISVIAGGAKYGLSHPEWTALGQPASINVPIRLINTYGAIPRNGTYLRNHANGNIVIIAGSAKYSLTAAQYDTLGKPAFTNVPIGFINRIGTDPTNGTYLRNPVTASVYLTVGGAKHGLSYDEWIALGQPAPTNVPIEWINTFGAIPRNGTYLRNPVDGTIYAITNNHKKALSYDEWAALGKPDSTNVPINYLNTIPNA
ncbi:M23 family metallopeptidase [Streptosporangium sp. NBC_01495]|uniref:M23 family metallopeptidase n=1 Tax=Streptosporangium sp. NBC_01495 TaxID=2903899 RepID=UPI002E32D9D1|nr:M23 family metallopeptidase [Streptosporangium sp. NBC_01495]